MKRREAIQQLGWGLSSGIWMPAALAACAPKDPGPEVVYSGTVAVIGAGTAGLYAADILHTKGIKVKIFEARDQIGGRVRSLRNQSLDQYPVTPILSSDYPVELGAQTTLGSDSLFGKIFKAYSLASVEFPVSSTNYVMDKLAKSEADWGSDPDFAAAKNFRKNLRGNVGNASTVLQAIQSAGIKERAYGILNGTIGNAYGSNNTLTGIGELAEEETLRTTDGLIIAPKSNPMQDILISRFSNVQSLVQVNTPIVSVNYSADPIVLTAKDGTTYTADKVIVTVPVSVLKTGVMSFTPGLPGTFSGSLAKLQMGASIRVVLEFKKNFWGDTVGFILGSSGAPEYLSAGLGRGQVNTTLSVTVNGDLATQYSALGDGVVEAILADLDLLYAGQGTQFIRKDSALKNIFIVQDWTKMPYLLGGYSYPLPGAKNTDRKSIGQSINDKLFFAGEATDVSGQAGTVNGALASAERVTQEVVTAIKKV